MRGARTALFNWLFARQHGGDFVLRLYDVLDNDADDEARLIDDLSWLGLVWDEGPDVGGERGPYRGSQRLEAYYEGAMALLERDRAYRCFCTPADLEEEQRRARAAGLPPVYSGRCASMSRMESDRRAGAGEPFVLRFRVPESGEVIIHDLIRERVTLGAQMVGDFVVLNSSSLPSYDFAAVMDDRSMQITHVLRGEERLPNTLRQALLYSAMEFERPEFGHLPSLNRPDGDRLAGRRGIAGIRWFRSRGYLPQAMVNYLAILGRSQDDNREIMDLGELIESFSIGKISLEEVVFEPMKLSWMNAHYIRSLSEADFWKAAESFIPREWTDRLGVPLVRGAALVVRGRAKTLEEVAAEMAPILEHAVDGEAAAAIKGGPARRVLAELLLALDGLAEVTGAEFLRILEVVRAATASDKRTVFSSVRAAITGKLEGPEIGAVAELLGAEELRARIGRSLRSIKTIE